MINLAWYDMYKGIGAGTLTSIKNIIYFVPVLLILVLIYLHWRNKTIYKHPVRIFKIRENGKVKEINCKGGYIGRKNSAPFFRIKLGKWWWQVLDLTTTPDPKYMDEDDRVYYKQIDVDTYVQMKRTFAKSEIIFNPVETDVKYGAILSVQRIKDVLRLEPTWKKVMPYAGLTLMAVIFIVAYAMLMKQCSG